MKRVWSTIASCLLLSSLTAGCLGGRTSPVEEAFGTATREVEERQTAHPERSERSTPVLGMGATTAADVTTNYHRNQQTEVQERRQERQRDNGLSEISD